MTAVRRWFIGDGESRRLEFISLGIVAAIGLIRVADPLWANQATFALFASEIADGEVLYKEVVDLKQPGVFIFYLIAQLPFGRNTVGIHLVELATWLAFGRALQKRSVSWFKTRELAATLPIATIGTYYLAATYKDQTQVEPLINIPLLAAVLLVLPDDAGKVSRRPRLSCWPRDCGGRLHEAALCDHPVDHRRTDPLRRAARSAGAAITEIIAPATAGAALLIVPFFVYFGINDAYSEIYDLYFVYSRERDTLWPRPRSRLIANIKRAGWVFAPFFVLIALGLAVNARAMLNRRTLAMAAWSVLALPLLWVQLWWGYHLFLWLAPITIVAWFGVDAVLSSGRTIRDPLVATGIAPRCLACTRPVHRRRIARRAAIGHERLRAVPARPRQLSTGRRWQLRRRPSLERLESRPGV